MNILYPSVSMQNCADGSEKPVVMILGNKTDLEAERRVGSDSARQAAEEFDALFAEVSAKTGEGVDTVGCVCVCVCVCV